MPQSTNVVSIPSDEGQDAGKLLVDVGHTIQAYITSKQRE